MEYAKKVQEATVKVAEARKKALDLKEIIETQGKTPQRMIDMIKALDDMEQKIIELEIAIAEEEAAAEKERARQEEEARRRSRSARLNGDPHFVGFDGKRYDVMPARCAILFEANEPLPRKTRKRYTNFINRSLDYMGKDFCVTGLHKTPNNAPAGPDVPSWTTGVFIKFYDITIFYDVDRNLLRNGVPAPEIYIFQNGAYYYLDDTDGNHRLVVWHPTFGRVVVENCEGFNLNITLVLPEEVFQTQTASSAGIMLSKEANKDIWVSTRKFDTSRYGSLKDQNPGLSDEDIMNLLFDSQFTPEIIREKVLQANAKSVVKQIDIIKKAEKPRNNIGELKIGHRPGARVHFSGHGWSTPSILFVEDQKSEVVGEGDYPYFKKAFPKVSTSLEIIAVDRGTRVVIYPQQNFQGTPLLDLKGPCIIWDDAHQIAIDKYYFTFLKEFQSMFPTSVRHSSPSVMNQWFNGSIKISSYDNDLDSVFNRLNVANNKFENLLKINK